MCSNLNHKPHWEELNWASIKTGYDIRKETLTEFLIVPQNDAETEWTVADVIFVFWTTEEAVFFSDAVTTKTETKSIRAKMSQGQEPLLMPASAKHQQEQTMMDTSCPRLVSVRIPST